MIDAVGAALGALPFAADLFLTPSEGLDEVSLRVASEGSVFDGAAAVVVEGAPNACHENVAALAVSESAPDGVLGPVSHWFGWALSPDGMWRVHSWGVAADTSVVETTVERVAYFGVELTAAEVELVNPSGPPSQMVKLHVNFGPESRFGDSGFSGESFWASPVEGGFRAENVPFFAEGFTIGSVLSARRVGGGLEATGVVSHEYAASGAVSFSDDVDDATVSSTLETLAGLGCATEHPMGPLYVIAAPEGVTVDELGDVLGVCRASGTSRSSPPRTAPPPDAPLPSPRQGGDCGDAAGELALR